MESKRAGYYYCDGDSIVHVWRNIVPETEVWCDQQMVPIQARIERLDHTDSGDYPLAMIVGGLHADEEKSLSIAYQLFKHLPYSNTQIPNAHIYAGMLGLRTAVVPSSDLHQTAIQVSGEHIDLNRLFGNLPPGENISLDDIVDRIKYPEAKLLIAHLQQNPHIQSLFTIHEDHSKGLVDRVDDNAKYQVNYQDGFYFYWSSKFRAGEDPDEAYIRDLSSQLITSLMAQGYAVYEGIDDSQLNLYSHRGVVYQPLMLDDQDVPVCDSTFENFVTTCTARNVRISSNSTDAVNIKHSFTFEIPKHLSDERKTYMIKIIRDQFMIPYLTHMCAADH